MQSRPVEQTIAVRSEFLALVNGLGVLTVVVEVLVVVVEVLVVVVDVLVVLDDVLVVVVVLDVVVLRWSGEY